MTLQNTLQLTYGTIKAITARQNYHQISTGQTNLLPYTQVSFMQQKRKKKEGKNENKQTKKNTATGSLQQNRDTIQCCIYGSAANAQRTCCPSIRAASILTELGSLLSQLPCRHEITQRKTSSGSQTKFSQVGRVEHSIFALGKQLGFATFRILF